MNLKQFLNSKNSYSFLNGINSFDIKYNNNLNKHFDNWTITSNYPYANNHCAAVTSTNIDSYYSGEFNFKKHYDLIGNGPVLYFANKTKKILKEKSIDIKYKRKWINKIKFIINSIDNNNLIALLLALNYKNYHWIICTGYIITNDDIVILEIIDNWSKNKKYYIPGKNSFIMKAVSFEIKN